MKKVVKRPNARLDSALKEMFGLQTEIKELSALFEDLKREVFTLVEAAGDVYKTDNLKAQIIRSQSWHVNAVGLLEEFGEKAFGLLTVSPSKFRKAFETGMFGTKTGLKGIARLRDEAPRFQLRLLSKK